MIDVILDGFFIVCEKYSNEKLDCCFYSVLSGMNIMRLVL